MKPQIKDHAFEQLSDSEAAEMEDTLWWLQGRKAIIRNYLEAAKKHIQPNIIMDIGCGSGGNLELLAEYGNVIGIERSPVLARRARARGIAKAIIEQEAGNIRENEETQLFTLFDVLEHIEHDIEFIGKLNASAPQKHLLLISVPASPFLYGKHDKILHHYRRYSKKALRECLNRGGYRTLQMAYFLFFLFPFAILDRIKDNVLEVFGVERTEVNLGKVPPLLNQFFLNTLRLEAKLAKHFSYPTGLWLFALAEKREMPLTY